MKTTAIFGKIFLLLVLLTGGSSAVSSNQIHNDIILPPSFVDLRAEKYSHVQHKFIHVQDHRPAPSPYYKDPEGQTPSRAPHVNYDDLENPERVCDQVYRGECREEDRIHRSPSGRCNNLNYPDFGSSHQPMTRILPAAYDDAFFKSRSSKGSSLLPNPRVVSLAMRKLPQAKPTEFNIMVMQLGQFIDHDFVLTPALKGDSNKTLKCKACESWHEPGCAPIPIPSNDPFMTSKDPKTGEHFCLPFTRTSGIPVPSGFGRHTLEQINEATAYLDLSTVYGNDECRQTRLRLFANGHMAETRVMNFEKGVLPLAPGSEFEECRTSHGMCFLAGDDRSNEHLGIMVTHMLYLREHNRIAMKLSEINPHWDDERLYRVSRQINIAQYQHMVYNEFLPALIGFWKAEEYGLLPEIKGYYEGYDNKVNAGVLNEFATSVFRLGHTMIPDDFRMLDSDYRPVSSFPLVETFHNTTMIFPMESGDFLLRGMIGTRLKPFDLSVVDVALDRLFEKLGIPHTGEDLFARNIARGRDHGIPMYTTYREFCGLGKTNNFKDLKTTMQDNVISSLRDVYESVDDIDLYVGGLAEKPLPGALVGPTFACIVAFQFLNSKRGDRFWYENEKAGLTLQQIHAIRSTTSFASLICENMAVEKNHKIPLRALRLPCNKKNRLLPCSKLRKLDLTLWAEKQVFPPEKCAYANEEYHPGDSVSASPCLSCTCGRNGKLKCRPDSRGCNYPGNDEYCKLYCTEELDYHEYHDYK